MERSGEQSEQSEQNKNDTKKRYFVFMAFLI